MSSDMAQFFSDQDAGDFKAVWTNDVSMKQVSGLGVGRRLGAVHLVVSGTSR